MGRTAELEYAHASTRLVSEILLYVQRFDERNPPEPGPGLALRRASDAAHALESAARAGADLQEAYRAAAAALEDASSVLSDTPVPSFASGCRVGGHGAFARSRAAQSG